MTLGSSKYGFETQLDRQRREQMKEWKARAAEAREEAAELEVEYLAKGLDPIIQDILVDLLCAVERTDSTITWDGKTTWRINDENTPAHEWFASLSLGVSDEGIHIVVESDYVPGTKDIMFEVKWAREFESIGRLKGVVEEITAIPVRLMRPDVQVPTDDDLPAYLDI